MKEPSVPKGLIDYLEKAFRGPTPKPGDSLDKIMYQAGQVSVISHLLSLHERQNQET